MKLRTNHQINLPDTIAKNVMLGEDLNWILVVG
jgi:hypothetical protein